LEFKIDFWMIEDWSQGRRQPVTAETVSLAVPYDFLGHKKIVDNASRKDL
jgi:hypothetical protein